MISGADTAAVWLAQGFVSAMRDPALASARGERQDSWSNTVTGMGTSRDKTGATRFHGGHDLHDQELERLYVDDDVAGRAVDLIPDECWRPGYRLELDDEGLEKEVKRRSQELGMAEKWVEADSFGRLYGECSLVLGADDGQSASAPLALSRTKSDRFSFVEVLDRRYYFPRSFYTSGPKSGTPELYGIGTPGPTPRNFFTIHESRMITFGGQRTTRTERARRGWRDHSVLQRPYEVLRSFATGYKAVEQLLSDGPQGVYSINGLSELIAAKGATAVEARLELIDRFRSFVRAIAIDGSNEKFERQQVPFAGIPDALDRLMLRLAAALGEPMTLLFGMSPSGFATGDTDFRGWFNRCEARETNYLSPRVERFARALLGVDAPEDMAVCWGPLWTPTPKERSEVVLAMTQADKLDFDMGVREPEEIFLDRVDNPAWPGWYSASDEAVELREKLLEIHNAQAEELARNPPPPIVAPVPGQSPGAPAPGAARVPGAPARGGNAPAKPGAVPPTVAR